MSRHAVCQIGELPPGTSRIVTLDRRSIGVFNVGGRLYALRNVCPHQGGPLCLGTVTGTMVPSAPQTYEYGLEGRVIRCPWHGWEFDLETGRSPFGAVTERVRTYPVTVENGHVMLHLGTEPGPGAVELARLDERCGGAAEGTRQ